MISLTDARTHLRIDGAQDDDEIALKLLLAETLVAGYIGSDQSGSTYVAALDAATLLVLGDLWLNRESSTADPLSPAVKNILSLFRTPTYA